MIMIMRRSISYVRACTYSSPPALLIHRMLCARATRGERPSKRDRGGIHKAGFISGLLPHTCADVIYEAMRSVARASALFSLVSLCSGGERDSRRREMWKARAGLGLGLGIGCLLSRNPSDFLLPHRM